MRSSFAGRRATPGRHEGEVRCHRDRCGPGRSPLAERLGQAGYRTALIERHLVGGTCVNNGCIPTKTLVGSAKVADLARRARAFGVLVDDVEVDMRLVKARKDEVRGPRTAASRSGSRGWPT